MTYFILICQIDAITMLLFKFFQPQWMVNFMRKHHIIAGIYIILGAIGLFSAILHHQ